MPRKKKGTGDLSSLRSSLLSTNKEKPQQRNAANARERARMRVLSRAFCRLKTVLPWVPPDTKLSKLDTLRMAAARIAYLKERLENPAKSDEPIQTAMNLSWPFGFNRMVVGGSGSTEIRNGSDEEEETGLDDGDSSCGSGSSWEGTQILNDGTRTTDRIHLDMPPYHDSPSDTLIFQHPHHSTYHQNILSFS